MFWVTTGVEGGGFGNARVVLLKFGEEGGVAEVQRFGVFPVVEEGLVDALDDVLVVNLDGQLAAGGGAAGGEIDGADDGAGFVGEEELGVRLDVLEFVDLDAEVP